MLECLVSTDDEAFTYNKRVSRLSPVQEQRMIAKAIEQRLGDIRPAAGRERPGYPTQKPLALLERIIRASSDEGQVILDPFCGCGQNCTPKHTQQQRFGRRSC